MKKIFRLEGLGCPTCSAKMEKAISELDGVKSASINFFSAKLTIEAQEDKLDNIIEAAGKIIKKIEPHTKMIKS